jgi:hypothetical protein
MKPYIMEVKFCISEGFKVLIFWKSIIQKIV